MGAKDKTYVDNVFSTYLYEGTGSSRSINTDVDMTKGGMVWIARRDSGDDSNLYDTVRGVGKYIRSNTDEEEDTSAPRLDAFNSNGFGLGGNSATNGSGNDYVSWSFRKAKGFFDVVTYTGDGNTPRTVSHSLGCIPGCIMVKCTSHASNWRVYHRGNRNITDDSAGHYALTLNEMAAAANSPGYFADTEPTSTQFTVGNSVNTNESGRTYVAYLFAGGESTAATARSIDFNGSSQYLETASSDSSDFEVGTGDFALECWIKPDTMAVGEGPYGQTHTGLSLRQTNNSNFGLSGAGGTIIQAPLSNVPTGQWTHVAVTRSSGTVRLFFNGALKKTETNTNNLSPTQSGVVYIGYGTSAYFDGKISNLRFVKGTAVYTSSFRPSTEPLTNITNTKLLCCNSSTAAGSTVGSLTAYSSPVVLTDSPFDDPACFKFGESGKESIIKTGSYIGTSNTTSNPPEIYLGWEPQLILFKSTQSNNSWFMFDAIRGMPNGTSDPYYKPNTDAAETASSEILHATSTGYKLTYADAWNNTENENYVYIAIRRPDGYVGKPADAGTDVFTTVASPNNTNEPLFVSNFIVDFALQKEIGGTSDWYTGARSMGDKYLRTNLNAAEGSMGATYQTFDMNNGWWNGGAQTQNGWNSWMWKRHAGFDVVTAKGDGVAGRQIPHSLNAVPEMIWSKPRSNADHWKVYHKGLNGGTTPEQWFINLNETSSEAQGSNSGAQIWNNTAPTSTHFTLGTDNGTNANGWTYIYMLFSSVNGISKVGRYTGTGSDLTITLGFQPRFVLIKDADNTASWHTFDTTRGITSGNDKVLLLNENDAQTNTEDRLDLTSDGMTLHGMGSTNENNVNFIYYAHA